MDAIMGLFIITLGLILIFSFFNYEPSQNQVDFLAFDAMDFLSKNRISDMNNDYSGPGGLLYDNGNITKLDNTILEQIGEFYYRNITKNSNFTLGMIDPFISYISTNIVPRGYGFIIRIENTTVHNNSGINTAPMSRAVVITPRRSIVYGIYNETELFGPYIIEVLVWK